MEIVDPRVHPSLVPEGSKPLIINGPHGDEYRDLPSIRTPDHQIITRWTLSDAERRQILEGEDVYLTILSNGPINPVFMTVGPVDWTRRV